VFGRRRRRPVHLRVSNFLWPRSGWRRAVTYIAHRVARLPGSPYSIASGLSCGVAVSFTPLFGLHSAMSIFLAWIIGGNVLAAFIGTTVGNPWTFPFMWLASYRVGEWLLGFDGLSATELMRAFGHIGETVWHDPVAAVADVWPIVWPTLVGGIPIGIASWFATFYPLRRIVARYQQIRAKKRQAARKRVAASGSMVEK